MSLFADTRTRLEPEITTNETDDEIDEDEAEHTYATIDCGGCVTFCCTLS